MEPKNLGSRREIKRALRRVGLSQNAAGRLLGKSSPSISLVLRGKMTSGPILDGLRRLILERQAVGGTPPAG